jgi:DNA-binding XRE family transcriptional regulator
MIHYANSRQVLGNHIRNIRRKRSVSQSTFGEAIGLSQSAVSSLERGGLPLPLTAKCLDDLIAADIYENRTPGGAIRVGRIK